MVSHDGSTRDDARKRAMNTVVIQSERNLPLRKTRDGTALCAAPGLRGGRLIADVG